MRLRGMLMAFTVCLVAARACVAADPTPPNILFFITDDESAVERSAYGWSKLPTPAFDRETVADPPKGVHDTDYAGNFATFLKKRDASKPFFFWAGVMEPYEPSGPNNHLLLEKEFGVTLDEVSLPPFMEDMPRKRQARANFLYEICLADRHLARMLASLEERGLLENTLVVVTSDNGTAISDGSQELRGKASPYDLGCHVPLVMMWPARVPGGRTVTDFVSFADFAPTFLEAAGLAVPAGMTGRSLLPILASARSGRVEPDRDFIITGLEWHGEFDPESRSCCSIRDDVYAYLVRYANVDDQGRPLDTAALAKPVKEEFYDLEKDPWQLHDLAGDPTVAVEQERLATRLREEATRRGDPRFTSDMALFAKTRAYVQKRKKIGYSETGDLPFDE